MKLYTDGAVSYFATEGGISSLTLLTSGILSGGIVSGTLIPLAYDFSLGLTSGSITGWDLTFTLLDGSIGGTSEAQAIGTVFGSGPFSGSGGGTLTSAPGASLTTTQSAFNGDFVTVQAVLNVNWIGNGTLNVNVPINSFDVNPTAVPEPESVGLLGAGLALLSWRSFRSRKRRATSTIAI